MKPKEKKIYIIFKQPANLTPKLYQLKILRIGVTDPYPVW